ncbi:cytochrome P450 [Daedalea quercina L-15889]|uniref:Cytochrome P450 n=1 Tax=Daedalea quercina L-15889 TaxID=1314783 RepID=A0A165QER5_9APHY|nr:cytochrome P450 [Daedalea quercina L-15889]
MSVMVDLCATVILGTAISVVYWLLKQWWIDAQHAAYMLPGPRRIPLFGNAHQVGLDSQHTTFREWAKRYGDVIYLHIFNRPTLVLNSVEAARDLLDRRSAIYSDRPHFILFVDMFDWNPNPALMPYGPWWRQHRVWLHAGLMEKGSLMQYEPLLRRETNQLILALIDSPDEFALHIKRRAFACRVRFAGCLMLDIAYGPAATSVDDELIMLADTVVREAMDAGSIAGTLVDFFPAIQYIPSWFPGGGFKRRAARIRGMMHEMYNRPYEQVKATMSCGNAEVSFLSSLLKSMAADGDLTPQHEEHLKGAAIVLYTAQDEIDRVVGNARLPDFEDRGSLPYLEWTVGIPHSTSTTSTAIYTSLEDPRLSQTYGTSQHTAHKWYPDPDTFRPERFQEMDPSVAEAQNPRKLVFGFGRRICPGRHLADQILWLAIVTILSVFDICKARDMVGNEITPKAAFASGVISLSNAQSDRGGGMQLAFAGTESNMT